VLDVLAVTSGTGIITFTSLTPGNTGYSITINAAAGGAEVITYVAATGVIAITPRIGATAANVAAAVNADSVVSLLITSVVTAAGAGFSTAVANAAMVGGTGQTGGWGITVNGVAQYPKAGQATAQWTDTAITISLAAVELIAATPGDAVQVSVTANGITVFAYTLVGVASEPEIYSFEDGGVPFGAVTPGNLVIKGASLLQGMTFDTLALWGAGADSVTITALKPGDSSYTIEITSAGATAGNETVTKTSNAFVIDIEATVSSANQIATAINANGADSDGLLWATVAAGGAGTTNTVLAAAPMLGGIGAYTSTVKVQGLDILPANTTGTVGVAAWSDTQVTAKVTSTSLAGLEYEDSVEVLVAANGAQVSKMASLVVAESPEIDWVDPSPAAAGGDFIVKGADFLQDCTFDTQTIAEGASSVAITALKPGLSGITVTVTAGGGAAGLTFNPATGLLTLTPQTGVTDDDALATLINADASQCNGHIRAVSAGGAAAYTAASDQTATAMTGGVGNYDETDVRVAGDVALPANQTGTNAVAKWTDTAITVTNAAAGAATDSVKVAVAINNIQAASVSATLL
jgi:hypothetical protein